MTTRLLNVQTRINNEISNIDNTIQIITIAFIDILLERNDKLNPVNNNNVIEIIVNRSDNKIIILAIVNNECYISIFRYEKENIYIYINILHIIRCNVISRCFFFIQV